MSNLFGGGAKTASMQPTQAMGIQFTSSQYGPPVPVCYGTTKVGGFCIWYGDFKSTAQTQQSGGKGGGGSTTSGYTYSASFQLGLCEGPIAGINQVFSGTSTVSLSTVGAVVADGTVGQAAWSHLSGGFALGYSQTAVISVQNLNLGSSASLPDWNPEVQGLLIYPGSADANPADIVNDICTSTSHGINFPWLGSLTQYSDYCLATGLLLSPCYDQEQTAQQTLEDLFNYTNTGVWFSEGVLKMQPYGDIAVTGNGVTYTPNVTPLVDLGEADYVVAPGDKPITVTRKAPAECMNMVRVEFQDRSNSYHTSVVVATIDQDIVLNGGRADDTEEVDICKSAAVARFIAQNLVQQAFYIRNTYEFKLTWRYCYLEPMDIVTLTDANLGLLEFPVRITEVAEDESGVLSITAEEFPEGIGHSALYNTQPNMGATIDPNSDPGAVNPPYIFRGPGNLVSNNDPEIWVAVNGANALWGAAKIYLSHDGSSYTYVGTTAQPARYGALATALPVGSDPDTTNTPEVTLYQNAVLLGGTQADADNLTTLSMVDTEIMSYETATLVGTEEYQLSYLRRGAYGSAIAAHASGAPWVRLDDAIYRVGVDPSQIGSTIYLKFLSINVFGRSPRTLAEETAYTYVIGTNAELPDIPPVPANFTVTPVADGVSITWTNSNPAAVGATSIEYATASAGPFSVLAQMGSATTAFTHHFTTGATYYYRARARGPLISSGFSGYTAEINSYGKTVANGADVTSQQTGITVQNPTFSNGLTGWTSSGTWYVEAAGSSHQPDPIITTYVVHPGSTSTPISGLATDALVNALHIPVVVGQQVTVCCCVRELSVNAGALGYARISWRDINNNEIADSAPTGTAAQPTCGAAGTGTYGQCVTKVIATAPAGAVYAVAEPTAISHTSGYFTYCNVTMSIGPSTLDEVPDSATYAKVNAGQVSQGVVTILETGANLIANPQFTQQHVVGGGFITANGYICDNWSASNIGPPNAAYGGPTLSNVAAARCVSGMTIAASGVTYSPIISSDLFNVEAGAPFTFTYIKIGSITGAFYYNPGGTQVTGFDRINLSYVNASDTVVDSLSYDTPINSSYGLAQVTNVAPAGAVKCQVQIYTYFINTGSSVGTSGGGYHDWGLQYCKYIEQVNLASGVTSTLGQLSNMPMVTFGNLGSGWSGLTVSYTATTTSATVSVSAGTLQAGGGTFSYSASSITIPGSAGSSTKYYLFYSDPTFTGGAKTLQATTSQITALSSNGYLLIGSVTITYPTSGSGGGSGGGSCVSVDAYVDRLNGTMVEAVRAGDIKSGDQIRIMHPVTGRTRWGVVSYSVSFESDLYRVVTEKGVSLTCSSTAPIGLMDGSVMSAPDVDGKPLLSRDFESIVATSVRYVTPAGRGMVQHITCEDDFFLAGDQPRRYIAHHNIKPPP